MNIVSNAFVGSLGHDQAYIVKTIPPLRESRASLGSAPDQKARTLSSLKILIAQWKLFLYSCFASMDCMRVFTVSSGIVA